MSRQLLTHSLFHLRVFRIIGEFLPFPEVALVIVEFLGSVGVGDVAVAFGSPASIDLFSGFVAATSYAPFCCGLSAPHRVGGKRVFARIPRGNVHSSLSGAPADFGFI